MEQCLELGCARRPQLALSNAFLTNLVAAYTVNYTNPMVDTSIAALTLTNSAGVGSVALNINSSAFNVTGAITVRTGGKIVMNSNGIVNSASMAILNTGFYFMNPSAIVTNTGIPSASAIPALALALSPTMAARL